MLVTYNSTAYFVDRGRQGGLSYEMGRLLEKELNERFPAGNLHKGVVERSLDKSAARREASA